MHRFASPFEEARFHGDFDASPKFGGSCRNVTLAQLTLGRAKLDKAIRMKRITFIGDKEILVTGRIVKTASMRAEYYEVLDSPRDFVAELETSKIGADLFTFLQSASDTTPHFNYHLEWDSISVLPITSYENWWKHQIHDKTRNMVRKGQKKGIDVRLTPFDDALVQGIMDIYNESPVRQGRKFWHYGKDFETIRRDHITFLERSDFIGAFDGKQLVGFIKLVHCRNVSSLMQIISKMSYRDKAPTNALIAKAIEICAERNVPNLHYGVWSRGGLGEFKVRHGFRRVDLPRYFVPLTAKGAFALESCLHRPLNKYVPEEWIDTFNSLRTKWYALRYRGPISAAS